MPITVQFPSLNITCRFFPTSGLEGAICSCKSRAVCFHKVAAVLAYQKAHGVGINALEQSPTFLQEAKGAPRSRAEVIAAVKTLLEECVNLGLCHLSDSMRQRFATLAVSALGVNLPRLSRMLRSLSDEVQLNLDRDAKADQNRLFLLAARTYALCAALENLGRTGEASGSAASPQALVGWHRSQYEAVGILELVGLGAYHWQTASGYAGLTVLFWHEAGQQWYSWSEARPTPPGSRFSSIARYWQAQLWTGLPNPARASQSRFQLIAARKNRQNRLSSSAHCRATLIGPTDPATIDWGDRCFRDWQTLRTYAAAIVTTGLGEAAPLQAIVVLCPATWGTKQFDEIHQVLVWPVLDPTGQELPLRVPFRPVDQQRIETLEALDVEQAGVWGVVAQLNVSRSGLSLYPLSLLCHTAPNIINLSFPRDSKDAAAQTRTSSEAEKTQTVLVTESLDASKEPNNEWGDRDEPSDLADENSPTDLDSWPTLSLLEQRLTQLEAELQRWADRGSNVLTPASRQPFANEANLFHTVGLEVFAASLRTLANPAENPAAALLKLRYLCQLSQEVAVKARCQSN